MCLTLRFVDQTPSAMSTLTDNCSQTGVATGKRLCFRVFSTTEEDERFCWKIGRKTDADLPRHVSAVNCLPM